MHKVATVMTCLLLLLLSSPDKPVQAQADPAAGMRIDFTSLDQWSVLKFDKVEQASSYSIVDIAGGTALKAESDCSASILSTKKLFDAYQFPLLRWRWRVDKVQSDADPARKSTDDAPIRLFVVFKFDPENATLLERLKARPFKGRFGPWLPDRWLMYIWAPGSTTEASFVSPYTDRAHCIPTRQGQTSLGQWFTEEVNIVKDFERIFGCKPPREAWIAVMSDSDNTAQSAIAYIDYIEVRPADAASAEAQ